MTIAPKEVKQGLLDLNWANLGLGHAYPVGYMYIPVQQWPVECDL